MSRWWRAYDEAVDDPKLIGLSDQQHRFWFNILCVCSAFDGRLPDIRTVSIKLRMQPRKVIRLINDLRETGLLDDTNGLITPHNWEGRQYKSDVSTDRVKRFRKRERNVSGNVSETPPENREQNTDTEKKETRASALSSVDSDFDIFWQEWPNKVGKPAALKAFKTAVKRGTELAVLIAGVHAYVRAKPPDRPWLNPATFINQERWNDQPAVHNVRRNVLQAADDLIAKIRAFDEPAPSGIRDEPGQAVVRLLPQR